MLITADRIHNGSIFLPPGTTIDVADDGTINGFLDAPTSETVFCEGIICPGFVNVHCHLELSHMKGVIPERTGLIPFLQSVVGSRNVTGDDLKQAAMWLAYTNMLAEGIVAVGDIANTTDSSPLRADGRMHFQTFVEAIGFSEVNAARSFGFALKTWEEYAKQSREQSFLKESITPHAPYSVSKPLFQAIASHRATEVMSIHNQETSAEDEYYRQKTGAVKQLLGGMNIDDSFFEPTGTTSLRSYMEWLPIDMQYLLIHNTCTSREDVEFIKTRFRRVFWGLCPNANLYIEGRLPDVMLLHNEGMEICIGTDSLASNHQLSVMEELITLKAHFPAITWETLLCWATRNGAFALKMENKIGTLEIGKQPGLVNITGFDTGKPMARRLSIIA